jgi:hypothetical protein
MVSVWNIFECTDLFAGKPGSNGSDMPLNLAVES